MVTMGKGFRWVRGIKARKSLNYKISWSQGWKSNMENIAKGSVFSFYVDNNFTSWGEDLIMYVTAEPLLYIWNQYITLCTNYNFFKSAFNTCSISHINYKSLTLLVNCLGNWYISYT